MNLKQYITLYKRVFDSACCQQIIDREVEMAIRHLIQKKYPHHGIIGEEFEATNPESEFIWVLDPIDGTQSFITGKPLFGTLIALLHQTNQ